MSLRVLGQSPFQDANLLARIKVPRPAPSGPLFDPPESEWPSRECLVGNRVGRKMFVGVVMIMNKGLRTWQWKIIVHQLHKTMLLFTTTELLCPLIMWKYVLRSIVLLLNSLQEGIGPQEGIRLNSVCFHGWKQGYSMRNIFYNNKATSHNLCASSQSLFIMHSLKTILCLSCLK